MPLRCHQIPTTPPQGQLPGTLTRSKAFAFISNTDLAGSMPITAGSRTADRRAHGIMLMPAVSDSPEPLPAKAASRRPAAPLVRTAFAAVFRICAPPRSRALLRGWRERALCEIDALPSRSSARWAALEHAGLGLRPVAVMAFLPGGSGSLPPARLALERPIAIACLAERAPCFPFPTWSISSRTYSPAWVDRHLLFAFAARSSPSASLSPAAATIRLNLIGVLPIRRSAAI